jgi:hypothetical protein
LLRTHVDLSCPVGSSSHASGGAGSGCRSFTHRNTFFPQEPTMNKTFFQRAASLSLSVFFTATLLAGIGMMADTSAPTPQLAGQGTPAPRA